MDEKKPNPNQISIDVPEEIAGGVYSNFLIIGHTPTEFVLDFIQLLPGLPKAKVRSRIILAPQHAKRLLHTLEDNLRKFEASYGPIELPDQPNNGFPSPFGGPTGFA